MVVEISISLMFALTVYYAEHFYVLSQETEAQRAKSHVHFTQLCIQCKESGFEPRAS